MDLVQQGHFVFESGHHGDTWLRLDELVSHPRELRDQAERLAGLLTGLDATLVCGPQEGGALVAHWVAYALDLHFTYARREPGPRYVTPSEVELKGHRVIVVDDAINMGSATISTVEDLLSRGCEVVALASLLVCLPQGPQVGARLDLPQIHLTEVPAQSWAAEECPLCSSGHPLDDPHP